jgi:isopenicillin-N N-acyltransferase like protein
MIGLPFPSVSGISPDPLDRGRQIGNASSGPIRASIELYRRLFAHHTGLEWERIRERAALFGDAIGAYDLEILREIEGVAVGAQVPIEDILAINARTEIMFGLSVKLPPAECTSFYVGPNASSNGHVLLGENWDWNPGCAETAVLLAVEQGDRPAFISMVEAGQVAKVGLNEAGIAVSLNALLSELDIGEPVVPVHVVLRGILNATTLEEAVTAVVRARRAASANFTIASVGGDAVQLETGPGGVETVFLTHPKDDLLAHANSFTCPTGFRDVGDELSDDSGARRDRMQRLLATRGGAISRKMLAEALRDHVGFPNSICRHPDETQLVVDQACTVASVIIDVTDSVVMISDGPPCVNSYATWKPSFAASIQAASA